MKAIGFITLFLFAFAFQSTAQTCLSGNCSSGYGKFKYANGDIYEGEFYDDKREGFGVYTWTTGEKFMGESLGNVFTGFGRMEYTDKTTYVGEFFNGEFGGRAEDGYGEGEKTLPDGTKQIGLFKDGKYYGKTSYYGKPVGTTGCLNGDCQDGYGMYYYRDKERYFGYFKNGKREGYGAFYWEDGTHWSGHFVEGKLTGYGTYFFITGEKYVGYFIESKRNGWGINYDPNTGVKKIGFWKDNDLITPKSSLLKDGNSTGCLSGDCKNGFGKYVYSDGYYEGFFRNGYPHGQGSYYFDIGDYYVGNFTDNKFNGKGTYYYTNGEKYTGEWKDQRNHGKGELVEFGGVLKIGYWKEGKYVDKTTPPPGYDAWVKNNYNQTVNGNIANNTSTNSGANTPVTTNSNTKPTTNKPANGTVTPSNKTKNKPTENTKLNNTNVGVANGNTNTSGLITSNYKTKVALIIGNQSYRFTTALKNPKNDARAMAQALRNCGFEVTELIDGTVEQMNQAIREFGGKIIGKDVALFYYSGHGMQIDNMNYIIPIDFKLQSKADVSEDCPSVSRVLKRMADSRTKLNIVILDACRNNPFDRGSFDENYLTDGLASISPPNNTVISFATDPGSVASDGVAGTNGLYTGSLIKYISTPNMQIENVFKLTGRDVKAKSDNKQKPWLNLNYDDIFYFKVQ